MLNRDSHFKFISISHQNAPLGRRERFYIADPEKGAVADALCKAFPRITSLLLLVTCNRTEVYFEADGTPAAGVRDFLLEQRLGQVRPEDRADFTLSDQTGETIRHLLRVSAGLESSVLGDAEIIHQVKKAYHFSLERNLQGSVLERCLQTVFRFHKRVSNETAFRDGTTSTAYKALKLIGDTFGAEAADKKILFVGAGDIVGQLFKYNTKFGYRNLWITNRTQARAERLAQAHRAAAWPWERLLENDLAGFDVVISAVSNASALIHKGIPRDRKVLLVDLAVPGNIAPALGKAPNVLLADLDHIASHIQQNKEARLAATQKVERIIAQEWEAFMEWHAKQPYRDLLAGRKQEVVSLLSEIAQQEGAGLREEELDELANRMVRKLLKNPASLYEEAQMHEVVWRNLPLQAV
jgi:glutamyl-tRNA reductase